MKLQNCIPTLFVKDAVVAKDFYVQVLGMTVVADFGGQNFIFKENFAIWQIGDDNVIVKTIGRQNIENENNASRFELCFETTDIDEVYQTLKSNNVKFLHEINTEIWGQRTVRFYDIDRHLIEIGEAMSVFLRRIFDEEKQDIEATSLRTFMPAKMVKEILGV